MKINQDMKKYNKITGYKTKYLCSELAKFFKNLLTEKSDQKQVSPIKNNFKISFVLIKQKIKEEMFKGNKQYPNKQNPKNKKN